MLPSHPLARLWPVNCKLQRTYSTVSSRQQGSGTRYAPLSAKACPTANLALGQDPMVRRIPGDYRAGVSRQPTKDSHWHEHVSEERDLKIIGLGKRGVSAVNRLVGTAAIQDAEYWALDSCAKGRQSNLQALASCNTSARTLQVAQEDDSSLNAEDLRLLVGHGASTTPVAHDAGKGVVFVLGSALGSPGGATLMLQLVNHLRRQGFFVTVALTRPFEFEGARKLEQATTLIEAMQDVAHLLVVVEQDVLTKASSGMTMGEASAIADNTLEFTVRSVLWALHTPEVLKLTNSSVAAATNLDNTGKHSGKLNGGSSSSSSAPRTAAMPAVATGAAGQWAFVWHGRDLRNIPRLLFPPMLALLTCPGHGTLGRGQAAVPFAAMQQVGMASTCSTLAEDAVKAAARSPFLDGRLSGATAVLCVLRLPGKLLGATPPPEGPLSAAHAAMHHSHREHAIRSAVQVAAMMVHDLAGPLCTDIIVCPQLRDDDVDSSADAGEGEGPALLLSVEASLLVICAIEGAAASTTITAGTVLPAPPAESPSAPPRLPSLGIVSESPPASAATAAARLRRAGGGDGFLPAATAAGPLSLRGHLHRSVSNTSGTVGQTSAPSSLSPLASPATQPMELPQPTARLATPRCIGAAAGTAADAAQAAGGAAAPASAAAVVKLRRNTNWLLVSALAGGSAISNATQPAAGLGPAAAYQPGLPASPGSTAAELPILQGPVTAVQSAVMAAPSPPPPPCSSVPGQRQEPTSALAPEPTLGQQTSAAAAWASTTGLVPAGTAQMEQEPAATPYCMLAPMPSTASKDQASWPSVEAGMSRRAVCSQSAAPPPPSDVPPGWAGPQRNLARSTPPLALPSPVSPPPPDTPSPAPSPAPPQALRGARGPRQLLRMPNDLAEALVAQSLDLPPGAAKWRHQQRAPTQAAAQRGVYIMEEAEYETDDGPFGGVGLFGSRQVQVDVRARAAGMLDRERDL